VSIPYGIYVGCLPERQRFNKRAKLVAMKPDDHGRPKALPVDGISRAAIPDEQDIPEPDRVIRRIVKGATNASAVLDSIVEQWNAYQHGGRNG
jgi:hypothetical protein